MEIVTDLSDTHPHTNIHMHTFPIRLSERLASQPNVWECGWGRGEEGATCHCLTQLLLFNQLRKAHSVLADPHSSSQPVLVIKSVFNWPQNGKRRKGIPAALAGSPTKDYKGNGKKAVALYLLTPHHPTDTQLAIRTESPSIC